MTQPTPTIFCRLSSMIYEGILLFGVFFISAYVFLALSQQKHLSQSPYLPIFQLYIFVIFGIYFVYCWTRSGQTLAMKSWGIRMVDQHGKPLKPLHALLRYVLGFSWYLPTLLLGLLIGRDNAVVLFFSLIPSILLWSLTALLSPSRQFLHDRLARTQLVQAK